MFCQKNYITLRTSNMCEYGEYTVEKYCDRGN